ncbi:hypothetical protein BASA81_002672 [Batrachochytrium salamandrivorans]|nr:hypothetical protein BASA81_002672 [Batrachochytrium salamandrivorans]
MARLTEKHRAWVARTTGGLSCFALLFLILASALPLFVVATLEGDYDLLNKHYSVDMRVGTGLFRRNVCYGKDRPNEDTLKKFGLSCAGHKQTYHCDWDDLKSSERTHCHDFMYMQGNEIAAIVFIILANLLAAGSLTGMGGDNAMVNGCNRFGATLFTFIAMCCAAAVIGRIQESDAVKFRDDNNMKWDCFKVLGAELCHGYGSSYYLQGLATTLLVFAFVGHLLLVVAAPLSSGEGSKASASQPLIG